MMPRRSGVPKRYLVDTSLILDFIGLGMVFTGGAWFLYYTTGGVTVTSIAAYNDVNYIAWALIIIGVFLIIADNIFLAEEGLGHKFRFQRNK